MLRDPKPDPDYVKGVKGQRRIAYFKNMNLIETLRKIYDSKNRK